MKPIKLTEQQEEKLLEMIYKLFPEEKLVRFTGTKNSAGLLMFDRSIYLHENVKRTKLMNFHWFEFCYKHLAKKVLKNNYYKLTAFTNLTIIGNVHPIDYLYQHYKSQK